MDPAHSPLSGLVDALAESERFRAFAADFPANARVSEPVVALLLATLHRTLGRPLVCLLAEYEEARDLAEAVGWYADPHCSRAVAFTKDPALSRLPNWSASARARSK